MKTSTVCDARDQKKLLFCIVKSDSVGLFLTVAERVNVEHLVTRGLTLCTSQSVQPASGLGLHLVIPKMYNLPSSAMSHKVGYKWVAQKQCDL